ncbi:uncharacterized protein LOC123293543 [Chrysoperla carnea]|uniref:uncharacterized protein LOC123293543 n=1 Tax=Chrysoperla carnea TaxID=189513 RepID=UPI001D083EEE|nr:uncharacterized protein LOC123293543 [Chrysoperla carnea]
MNCKIKLISFMITTLIICVKCDVLLNNTDKNVADSTKTTPPVMFTEGENIPVVVNPPRMASPSNLTESTNSTHINLDKEVQSTNATKHNTITARKGVNATIPTIDKTINQTVKTNITEIKSTTVIPSSSTTTTTTEVPKIIPAKPTVTIGADEPYAPSHFLNKKAQIKESIPSPTTKLNDTIDKKNVEKLLSSKVDEGPDYIVPIVITILSVPLFIALMMLAYRHGADWWDRRHYRRMDYLIEGIYNN